MPIGEEQEASQLLDGSWLLRIAKERVRRRDGLQLLLTHKWGQGRIFHPAGLATKGYSAELNCLDSEALPSSPGLGG